MLDKGDIPRHTQLNPDMSGQNRTKELEMVNLYETDNFDKPVEEVNWGKGYATGQVTTIAVIVPRIGTHVEYQGKWYIVLQTTAYVEDTGEAVKAIEYPKMDITVHCRILRIDDEGEDAGEEAITVNSDELTEI